MYLVTFVCVLILTGAQAQVLFNSTYDCSQGCSILDPEIYIGNTLPTPEQNVTFNVTGQNEFLYVPAGSTYNVTSLFVSYIGSVRSYVKFLIGNSATLSVTELAFSRVYFEANTTAQLVVQQNANIENGHFISSGQIEINSAKFSNTSFYSYNTSLFYFFYIENGHMSVNGGFNSSVTVFLASDIGFAYSGPNLGTVVFTNTTVFVPEGFYAGTCIISSSNFSGTFPDEFVSSLTIMGDNNLQVDNIHVNSDKIRFIDPSFTTFQIYHASFAGNLAIPGEIIVKRGFAEISFNGTFAFSGGLQANTYGVKIRSTGSLGFGGPVSLFGQPYSGLFSESVFEVAGGLLAPSMMVENFLVNLQNGTIVVDTDLNNNGSIYIFEPSSVTVKGNYTQLSNTTFAVFNLSSSVAQPANLVVQGTAYIAGDLQYNTSETKNRVNATVIQAQRIQGTFATSKFKNQDYGHGNEDSLQATLNYNEDSVQLLISPRTTRAGLPWWVFVLIGAGALVVVLGIVLAICVVRRRSPYQNIS